MLATAGAGWFMLHDDAFRLGPVHLHGDLRYTPADVVLNAAGLNDEGLSTARVDSDEVALRIRSLPAIADAHVEIALPNRVDLYVTERQPIFAIRRDDDEYLVDDAGVVLAHAPATTAEALGLPVVQDARSSTSAIDPGTALDPIEVAAITQLAAITPSLVDSRASALVLSESDDDGFVISAQPQGWRAIFGQYTPNLRPVDLIPRQVQCLRSLLGASESAVQTVYLAPLEQNCGTYLPTPGAAAPTPAPSKSH
jgi:hypothetical protein